MSNNAPVSIDSISDNAAETLTGKLMGTNGTLLLTSASNYTGTAGQSPKGNYIGFLVGSAGTAISAITFTSTKHKTYGSETLNDLGLVAGLFYSIDGIEQIRITAGAILLYRKENY